MLLVAQTNVFKGVPILTGAKAIKHKTSHTTASEGNTIESSSSSQPNRASSPRGCITHNPSTRTITISCSPARLTDIDNKLHDSSLLAKQSPTATWFLSANLIISKGSIFHIDSTDTKWLKINSKVDRSSGPKIGPAYTGVLHNL